MTQKNDGGPAFPSIQGQMASFAGMSLRDWFAGQALAGYFAYQWTEHQNSATVDTAKYIYQMADAMMDARK